jgi:hypothetical protein
METLDPYLLHRPHGVTLLAGICLVVGILFLLLSYVIIIVIKLGHIPVTSGLYLSLAVFVAGGIWGIGISVSFIIGKKLGWLIGIG